jgi:hypothetical protein
MGAIRKLRLVAVAVLGAVVTTSVAIEEWRISEAEATKNVLSAYPGILRNAHLVGPVEATLRSDVAGFGKDGDKVWHVRIHCDKGGPNALFFVHPHSGEVYPIMKPGEKGSTKCQ